MLTLPMSVIYLAIMLTAPSVNNALCCTENSFNQDTLSSVSLAGHYGKVTLNCNKNPEQSGRILECFSVYRLSDG